MVHENQHFAAQVLENKGQWHMYDTSERIFFILCRSQINSERFFQKAYLDLGSMELFLIYKQKKYLKTGV